MIEDYKTTRQLVNVFLQELEKRQKENQKQRWNPGYPDENRL